MNKKYIDILIEEMTQKGYKVIPSDESNVLCEANVSVCRKQCYLCEQGQHFEKIGSDGLTRSERAKRPLTDKQIKIREYKNRQRMYLSFFLMFVAIVLNFDFVIETFGEWFKVIALILLLPALLFTMCSLVNYFKPIQNDDNL